MLQYIVPGYLAIKWFEFTLSRKINTKNSLIFSCVASYCLLAIVSLIRVKLFNSLPDTTIINSAIAIVLGCILVSIIAILSQWKYFRKITVKLFIKL